MLDRCPGPDCPDCGCNDTQITAPPSSNAWFARLGRARCNHCGLVFSVQPEAMPNAAPIPQPQDDMPATIVPPITTPLDGAGVVYHVLRCPSCRSEEVKTTSTQRPVRYHKCRNCGGTFKSVEHE